MATKMAKSNGKTSNRISEALNAPNVMKPEIVTFKVVGISPLLQNNPSEFIGGSDDCTLGQKKTYIDEEEAAKRCYKNDDLFVHPAEAFIKSMVKAVTGLKFGKKSAPGILKGSVFIAEPWCPILDANGKPAKNYVIDRRTVVNPTNKARVLRCRPLWSPWSMEVALEIDTALIDKENVRESMNLAGRKIGIGDFRPEKSGGFGRFYVE